MCKIDIAIALLIQRPELADTEIAPLAKCSKSLLSTSPECRKYRKGANRALASGTAMANRKAAKDCRTGEVSAED